MKKITLILAVLLGTVGWAATLNTIYHANYGEIDRVVLVLSSDIDYSITSRPKKLKITLRETVKGTNVVDEIFNDNQVLEAWDFQIDGEDLQFIIYTDKKYVTQKTLYYKEKQHYKLVIDIFNTLDPQTYEELMSYASYNQIIKKNQVLAQKYREKAEELKKKSAKENNEQNKHTVKKEETAQEETEANQQQIPNIQNPAISGQQQPSNNQQTLNDSLLADSVESKQEVVLAETLSPESIFVQRLEAEKEKIAQESQRQQSKTNKGASLFTKIIVVIVQLLLAFFILKIVIKLIQENIGKKKKLNHIPKIKEVNYRSEAGFGDDDFKREVIEKLKLKGWKLAEIAQELELSEGEVISYLQTNREEQKGEEGQEK
jgi:hypothetical protein